MQKKTRNFLFRFIFIILLLYLMKVKAQLSGNNEPKKYEIHLYFNSIGPQALFCDFFMEFFETEYMNVYKIGEGGTKKITIHY